MGEVVTRARWSPLAVVAVLAVVTAHPLCNVVFRCGCSWFSTAHCNLHASMGPRCPWCTVPWTFVAAGALWMVGAAAGLLVARRLSSRWWVAMAAALVGFAVGVAVSGALTAWLTGYPRLFV